MTPRVTTLRTQTHPYLADFPLLLERYQYPLLGLFALIALVLRLYQLGEWSFWIDELHTIRGAQESWQLSGQWKRLATHGLSLRMTGIVLGALGITEWSARLVFALFGTLSILLIYFPVRRLLNVNTALLTSLFLALSPWHLYLSQNARYVSALLFFAILALFSFYLALEEDRLSLIVGAQICLALAMWERPSAVLLIPILLGYTILVQILPFEKPKGLQLRNIIAFFIPGLLPALFFFWRFIREPSQWINSFVGKTNTTPLLLVSQISSLVRPSILILAIVGGCYLLARRHRSVLLLSLGATLPILTIMLASIIQFSQPRYAIISLVCWLALAGAALSEMAASPRPVIRWLAIGALFLCLLDLGWQDMRYYQGQNVSFHPTWKSAFEVVNDQRAPNEMVYTSPWRTPLAHYYLKGEVKELQNEAPTTLEEQTQRAWFVLLKVRIPPEWNAWLPEHATLIEEHREIVIYLYEP